jgi:TfoX/Sxy family transcriptional regulator of competence genes
VGRSREQKLTTYQGLIDSVPDIERKGKKTDYTSLNGNMFSFLSPEGILALRLSKSERDDFLARHPDATVEQYGHVMKDYIEVPDTLLEDQPQLDELFALCVANARTLKPKATTRPEKAT